MSTSQNVSHKSYGLFVLAILLLLLGGVGMYLGSDNYPIRVMGAVALIVSVYLARISRVPARSGSAKTIRRIDIAMAKGPGRVLWIISLAMVPLLGIAWLLLHIDAVNGGHEAWPVDVFAGVGLACALVWGYLVAKIMGKSASKN